MAAVLEGIKVIDLSQVAAVPMCARFLADFGADVIHVEHAHRRDPPGIWLHVGGYCTVQAIGICSRHKNRKETI